MSKHAASSDVPTESGSLEEGRGLRSRSQFRGAVAPHADHGHGHDTDHFASIYDSQAEQFAAVIPFVREGLERGEQCLYIAHENSSDEVLTALRDAEIDVDAALESGALTVLTSAETYRETGAFDRDAMLSFWEEALEAATTDGEYTGVRAAAEMSWAVETDITFDRLIEYEAALNSLYEGEAYAVLCQYDRNRVPADVVRDVISTHPRIVHDGRVSHNTYYTPPEAFFGHERSDREVDRLLGTLREQTDARAELRQRERFLRESHRITSNLELGFEEKLERLLELGCEWMGLDAAGLTHLPEWGGKFRNEYAVGYGDGSDGEIWTDPSEGCYCRQAIESERAVGKADVRGTDWEDDGIHREHGLSCYLGTKVTSGSTPYGTLWVGSTEPRDREFSDAERTLLELLGQWVSYELERRERNDAQRELYAITSDPELGFEEKLDAVFELGRDQFGLELGGMAKVDPDADRFEVEHVSGDHDHLVPGAQVDLSETYCRVFAEESATPEPTVAEPVGITDPAAEGFDDELCVTDFGVHTYLGTHFRVDGGSDRTFFFVAEEPRTEPITDEERTFHRLMAQWVKYELERRQRERKLREHTEHLSALIETTPECIKTVAEDGTLLQMNPAGLEMVEAPSEPAVTGECVYDLIAPEHRERFREFNERICSGERGTLEFDVVGLEGTRSLMETHAAPLDRPDGTTVHVALTRDVTAEKRRKQALRESKERLQQSNERLEQFAYAASHDLQEPLRMVTSYLQLLERRYGDVFDEDAEEFLEYAVDGADRMREMIDGLLAYSRVETRGDPLESVELDAMLDDVLTDLQIEIDETDAEITAENLPRVEGDNSQLRQLFQNLLDNALTYSGDEPPRIHVGAQRRGEEWAISVRDNGIGIDPDDQERIFTVFDRLHSREEYEGTGLGLALCQRIVERHGGELWVDSEPGEGATFSFTLPAA